MDSPPPNLSHLTCAICRRAMDQWFLRLTVEDAGGFRQEARICGNCAVKLRLASEKMRDLQIDPWIHEAVAAVLRGSDSAELDRPVKREK